jgi:hypothetical protein
MSETAPSERLIHLIHVAGMATMMGMKHPSGAANKREDKAYAELFAYVMGRKPTPDELKQLVPS